VLFCRRVCTQLEGCQGGHCRYRHTVGGRPLRAAEALHAPDHSRPHRRRGPAGLLGGGSAIGRLAAFCNGAGFVGVMDGEHGRAADVGAFVALCGSPDAGRERGASWTSPRRVPRSHCLPFWSGSGEWHADQNGRGSHAVPFGGRQTPRVYVAAPWPRVGYCTRSGRRHCLRRSKSSQPGCT